MRLQVLLGLLQTLSTLLTASPAVRQRGADALCDARAFAAQLRTVAGDRSQAGEHGTLIDVGRSAR